MKLKIFYVLIVLMICSVNSFSQFNVLNRVKNKIGNKILNEVDKVIDQKIDTIGKKVTDKQTEKIESRIDSIVKNYPEGKVYESTGTPIGKITPVKNPKGKGKYSLKSAIVEYKTTIMGMESSQFLSFDNYGEKEANETIMKILGISSHSVTITGDDIIYTIDMIKRTGIKSDMTENYNNIDFERMSKEIQEDMKIKKEGTETIMNKECIKFSMNSSKMNMNGFYWVWKGIPLKTEMYISNSKITMEAVKLQENVSVPNEKFEIPADIIF